MARCLLLALVGTALAAAGSAAGETEVVTVLDGPVVLDHDLVVPPGATLELRPGTRVALAPGTAQAGITVRGRLIATGEPGAPVEIHVPINFVGVGTLGSRLHWSNLLGPGPGSGCGVQAFGAILEIEHTTVTGWDQGLCIESADDHRGGEASAVGTPHRGAVEGEDPSTVGLLLPVHLGAAGGDGPTGFPDARPAPVGGGLPVPSSSVDRGVRVTQSSIEANTVGIALERAASLYLDRVLINNNGIGIDSRGGRAILDHVVLDGNAAWDVRAERAWDIQWTGSVVEASCVKIAQRPERGCQRGGAERGLVLAIVGAVVLFSEATLYVAVRAGGLVRLYSRIDPYDVLDHPGRAALFELIEGRPGIHLSAAIEAVGGHGRTLYHLHRLEEAGLIRRQRDGMYLRFYVLDHFPTDEPGPAAGELVYDLVRGSPGLHAAAIARRLGISRQLASYHARELVRRGLVRVEKEALRKRLFARAGSDDFKTPTRSAITFEDRF